MFDLSRREFNRVIVNSAKVTALAGMGANLSPAHAGQSTANSSTTLHNIREKIASEIEDFSFIHISDTHLDPRPSGHSFNPDGRSVKALHWFASRTHSPIKADATLCDSSTEEDGIADAAGGALPAAFAIHTGDVFEYSVIDDCWNDWSRAIYGITCEVHCVPGNHDNTWSYINHHLRKKYGNDSHSFDHGGCHFVCLNSSGTLDPLPCWDQRTLLWLEDDLANVSTDTPVILAFHHPQSGDAGFASEYDKLRFWEIVRHHHIALMLDGHWHQVHAGSWQNIPRVNGGETFRLHTGYSTVSVSNGVLRQRYHFHESAQGGAREVAVLTHRIDQKCPRFSCNLEVKWDSETKHLLRLKGTVHSTGMERVAKLPTASAWLDEERTQAQEMALTLTRPAENQEQYFTLAGKLDCEALIPGRHYVTVRVEAADGNVSIDSEVIEKEVPLANEQAYILDIQDPRGLFQTARHQSQAGIKTPLLLKEVDNSQALIFGDTSGNVIALDAVTLEKLWSYETGSQVIHAVSDSRSSVIVGDGDGRLHYVSPKSGEGEIAYDFQVPIFAPGITLDNTFYFGDANGRFHAFNLHEMKPNWSRDVAEYCIESAPAYDSTNNQIILGAWDGYLYAIKRDTGERVWKAWNAFSQSNVKSRYYGPADCTPLIIGKELWAVDRGYYLGRFDTEDGTYLGKVRENVSAIVEIDDGGRSGVIARGLDHKLVRFDSTGKTVWEIHVPLGRSPIPPTLAMADVSGKRVLVAAVVSDTGILTLVNIDSEETLYQHAVTPGLFVQTPVTIDKSALTLYSAGMDGTITRLSIV